MSAASENAPQRPRMILMRALPSCGKSTTARALVARHGGRSLEFDAFFERRDASGRRSYAWNQGGLPRARTAFIARVLESVRDRVSPLVIDSDNEPTAFTRSIVVLGITHGYCVETCETNAPWWPGLRALLRDRNRNTAELTRWADKLTRLSRSTHRVPRRDLLTRMNHWREGLCTEDYLAAGPALRTNIDRPVRLREAS